DFAIHTPRRRPHEFGDSKGGRVRPECSDERRRLRPPLAVHRVCVEKRWHLRNGKPRPVAPEGAELDHLILPKHAISEPFPPGMRAVHYAARHGSLEMLKFLKERKTDMTSTSVTGAHPGPPLGRSGRPSLGPPGGWCPHGGLDAPCRSKDGPTALDVAFLFLGNTAAQSNHFASQFPGFGVRKARHWGKPLKCGIFERRKNGSAAQKQEEEEDRGEKGSGAKKREKGVARSIGQDLDKADKATRGAGDAGAAPGSAAAQPRRAAQEPGRGRGTQELDKKLLKAASDGDLEGVKIWLDEGADVEAASSAMGEEKGLRPLHLAAWAGHVGVVRELLRRGADFKARGRDGYSAIHYAARGGFVEVLKILHENKCNMKAKTDNGQTLLHVAADNGNLKAFEWIIENTNIDLDAKTHDKSTALELAQKARQKSIVTYLLKTPALDAFQKKDLRKVRELIAGGFDANAVFQDKKTKASLSSVCL
ncbi:ankyrin repeat domain-containing protein 65-like, partial [Penaeus monodon]|uniref:ankyrin repeat domain-containing protein 65-like n=1 Tax=Penaeus monodon TaxID=6687 RepID=UPI0018A7891F